MADELPDAREHVLTSNVRAARIARVYADALLGVAGKDGRAQALGDELDALVSGVLDKHPTVAAFLASPAVTRKRREPILEKALGGVSPTLKQFLGVLNQNNRLDLLRDVAAAYRDLLDRQSGRVRVTVRSAVPLDDGQRDGLKQSLAASLRKEPVLVERVDPDLLGGMVVQVGDKVYDSSVRSRLAALRSQLLTRGTNVVKA
jgi:F-type H+-transporting ATPase subunit delta